MDIRQLTYFHEVAKHKSFTKASHVLHVSQPSLSKMVRSLEEELGIELLDRSSRQIELTEAGEIVYDQGQMILESMNHLSTHLYDLMNLKRGKIRVGIPPVIGFLFFPAIIRKFKSAYPDIEIELIEQGANKIEEMVGDGLLDLGIVVLPMNEEKFGVIPFISEDLMLFVHASHPFGERDQVEMHELEAESFILFSEDFALHGRIIEECLNAGFAPSISYESSQWDFISGMIGENLGISILPQSIQNKVNQQQVKAIPITTPTIPWNLGIITKKGRYVSHAAKEFIHMLRPIKK
jgi:DNA-binding transcriptional LysR family regulator